uniref:Uncharacterized protein n=1 Tax=Globodera rostochiensis TaxID=31243 RepID=A0A914HU39_GLORO
MLWLDMSRCFAPKNGLHESSMKRFPFQPSLWLKLAKSDVFDLIDKTNQDLSGMIREKEEKRRCDAEVKCARCGGLYACEKLYSWYENKDGCCPTGYRTTVVRR